jgi:hypothetical protein
MKDEGGPLDVAVQAEASKNLKLLRLRVVVVSVKEKAKLNFVICVSWRRTPVNC